MTDEQAEALGRRLLAAGCPWVAGMRFQGFPGWWVTDRNARSISFLEDGYYRSILLGEMVKWDVFRVGVPDLECAATRGAVLEALRKKRSDASLHVICFWSRDSPGRAGGKKGGRWGVRSGIWADKSVLFGATEAEALVLAWEAS